MESLSDTIWDVVIAGTGLSQSLLALSLSRSGKKILHVDQNDYYGGPEAALSLQEAEEWAKKVNDGSCRTPFEQASVVRPSHAPEPEPSATGPKLSFSRAYSLSLSPKLLYAQSKLLPLLVSSRVYRQLEFQAVGSWWILNNAKGTTPPMPLEYGDRGSDVTSQHSGPGSLHRVPGSREDVFADESLDARSQRALMKFLRFVSQYEEDGGSESNDLDIPLLDFLTNKFHVPSALHQPILALSLSPDGVPSTTAKFAVSRIRRHLTSIGIFGPGFGAVIPKWGGTSEIAQVSCRAGAVGGGVYVLDCGIDKIETSQPLTNGITESSTDEPLLVVKLTKGESVRTRRVVGSDWDLPEEEGQGVRIAASHTAARSIAIVASSFESLFPPTAENGPIPAGAVVLVEGDNTREAEGSIASPVYLNIHSSDTGECPAGQCVVYASTAEPGPAGYEQLNRAIGNLLQTTVERPTDAVLWSLRYTQQSGLQKFLTVEDSPLNKHKNITVLSSSSLDLAFDDASIQEVQRVWETIHERSDDDEAFMKFTDREAFDDMEDDE